MSNREVEDSTRSADAVRSAAPHRTVVPLRARGGIDASGSALGTAFSAAAVTVPHALGFGLLAFGSLAASSGNTLSVAAMALWSAALPGVLLTLLCPRPGVVYAPTTVVALLYSAVLLVVVGAAEEFGLAPRQMLAVAGATGALAFGLQWLIGTLRLGTLVRFLPVPVMQGFAAGVGLSMLWGQLHLRFGAGAEEAFVSARFFLHFLAVLLVVGFALVVRRRWPRVPAVLVGAAAASALVGVGGSWMELHGIAFSPAAPVQAFSGPVWPDWRDIPWWGLASRHGMQLALLALLMALVNSLDLLIFQQEMDMQHGLRGDPNRTLQRESAVGMLCALMGWIPASTSTSRTRLVLTQLGPSLPASRWHAILMLGVAFSGAMWLHLVPMAAFSGALVVAGLMQIPRLLLRRAGGRVGWAPWMQAWVVALVFVVAGGVGAVVVGLVIATAILLRASAAKALRHVRLDGELRSRRIRDADTDAWLLPRMNEVAVFELQGVMSFAVAAQVTEQVRQLMQPRHRWVVLDAARVPAWDSTALVQLAALERDLWQRGIAVAIAGVPSAIALQVAGIFCFSDLDRALEWVETGLLDERPSFEVDKLQGSNWLGEIGHDLPPDAYSALQSTMVAQTMAPHQLVFGAGGTDRDLLVVLTGRITLATQWPPETGLRLSTVGPGMVFGEMAFLSNASRTASAGTEQEPASLARLSRTAFDFWAQAHPAAALVLMGNLAHVEARRLASTTRQLRVVLE